MSLVEVSPSTVTRLNVRGTISWRASWSTSWAMAQSVVMKHSMVPILGWIIPEPLAMPPIVTVLPPRVRETAISFFLVSVVITALAAASEPLSFSCSTRGPIPFSMASMFSVWPMTPVEATTKSVGFNPVALAAAAHIRSAFSWPMGAQALALPLLATIPRHTPSSRLPMVT